MTLNAITSGCNQKTSRDPVLTVSEAEVQATLDRLKDLSLAIESSGGRVMRYAHNTERVLGIPSQAVALVAVLMLRGAQTVSELRINSDRLHRFADVSAVEGFLHELAARPAGALVVELPRQPGTRETRWMHLVSGPPAASVLAPSAAATDDTVTVSELAALKSNVRTLEAEVAALRATVRKLCAELGVAAPPG